MATTSQRSRRPASMSRFRMLMMKVVCLVLPVLGAASGLSAQTYSSFAYSVERLDALPESHPSLTHVKIAHKEVLELGADRIASTLAKLPRLNSLEVSFGRKSDPSLAFAIADKLPGITRLTVWDVILRPDIKAFTSIRARLTSLKYYVDFSEEDPTAGLMALASFYPKIRELEIRDAAPTGGGLVSAFHASCLSIVAEMKLTSLTIWGFWTTIYGSSYTMLEGLAPTLEYLWISRHVDESLVPVLRKFKKLKSLRTAFARKLIPALPDMPALERFSAAGAKLTDEDVKTLKGLKSLKTLKLNSCELKDGSTMEPFLRSLPEGVSITLGGYELLKMSEGKKPISNVLSFTLSGSHRLNATSVEVLSRFSNLRELSLGSSNHRYSKAEVLKKLLSPKKITSLNIHDCDDPNKLFKIAVERGGFTWIDLPWQNLKPDQETLKSYVKQDQLRHKVLYQSWFESKADFLKALEANKNCRELTICDAKIDDDVLKAIEKRGADTILYIEYSALSEKARVALAKRDEKVFLFDVQTIVPKKSEDKSKDNPKGKEDK